MNGMWQESVCVTSRPGLERLYFPSLTCSFPLLHGGVANLRRSWKSHVKDGRATISLGSCMTLCGIDYLLEPPWTVTFLLCGALCMSMSIAIYIYVYTWMHAVSNRDSKGMSSPWVPVCVPPDTMPLPSVTHKVALQCLQPYSCRKRSSTVPSSLGAQDLCSLCLSSMAAGSSPSSYSKCM